MTGPLTWSTITGGGCLKSTETWHYSAISFNYAVGHCHTFKEWSKIPHCIIAWKHNKDIWNDWMSPLLIIQFSAITRGHVKMIKVVWIAQSAWLRLRKCSQVLVRNENDDTHNSYHAWKCHLETPFLAKINMWNETTVQLERHVWHMVDPVCIDRWHMYHMYQPPGHVDKTRVTCQITQNCIC